MKSFAIAFLFSAFSLLASDVTGKWAGNYDVLMTDGQTMKGKVVLNLTQSGSDITGTAGSEEGQMQIQNGKVDGDNVTFEVQTEGPKIVFMLRLEEEHLRGGGKGEDAGNTVKVTMDLTRG